MSGDFNAAQIHVGLNRIMPEIWRRLIVPSDWNLDQLHLVIQAAFGWWHYHLHEFRIGGLRYGDVEALTEDASDDDPRVFESRDVRLCDFEWNTAFTYVYDFGDCWRHSVMIEEFLALDVAPLRASCIGGARARPPEDVGGVSGYDAFLEIIADEDHPEYAETLEWCGGYFDPDWFDLAQVNRDVSAALNPKARRRLFQPKPKRSKRGRSGV
ncbi:MAG: plasmid pRiA4b ORF-3 family protein [Alphaproteobacteria bacterium]|nr:plasmid pRiA4b ORF-3 family protein [Alphaproteobacteria bacterium]